MDAISSLIVEILGVYRFLKRDSKDGRA